MKIALVLVLVVAAGCARAPTDASPTPLPVSVTTPEAAVAQVIAADKRLTGIAPRNPDAIGQSTWYEVAPASGVGAYIVTVRIGWGDCEAGCIDEHVLHYAVAPDGAVMMTGNNVGELSPDGLFLSMTGFWDPLTPAPA